MNDDDYAYRFQYADGSAFQIYADGTAYIMAKDGSIRDKPKGLVTNRIPMLVGSVAKPRQDRIDVLEEALHDLYNAVRNEEVEKVVMRQAASALDGVPAQCAPSLIEVASVIHEARFGRDYPENLRNSFDTECSSGRAYCIRLARAVMDGFRLSHVDASTSTEHCDGADDLEHLDGMLDDRERG